MNDVISRKELLGKLNELYESLRAAGDPILASVVAKVIDCVKKVPSAGAANG